MTATTLPTTPEALIASITDPREVAPARGLEKLVDKMALPYLINPQDVIFARLIFRVLTQVFPFAIALFFVPPVWALGLGVLYLTYIYARFAGPIMLGLHAVTHRPLFKKPMRGVSKLITHVFPPLWGLTPFAYEAHHVFMHHSENNGADDLSGTSEYRRDSILHFGHYWLRFFLFGYYHMASWMLRRDKKGLALLLIGDTLCYAAMVGLFFVNPAATLMVFFMPFLMMRFFMMAGTWTEHAFVDATQPDNTYRNSTCLINTRFNHIAYNAGYHLVHHISPGRHWCSTPAAFEKFLPKMIEQESILFYEVPDYLFVWWKLMRKDYNYFADHMLDLDNRWPTKEDKIAFLRSRTQGQRGTIKGLLERREAASAGNAEPVAA